MVSRVCIFTANDRKFLIRITSDVGGYRARLMEMLSDELNVPAGLHLPPRHEVDPSTFYRFRKHYRKELLELVKCELLSGRVKRLDQDEVPTVLDAHIQASLKGWPDGYPKAVDDDLSDWKSSLDN
jgi:hypothetical protein